MASVLTVEDSCDTQFVIRKNFESQHRVLSAYDLSTAKRILKTESIDLIVLDLSLPDGEGESLLKELSNSESLTQIPIIILSGRTDVETRVQCLKQGADDFVAKPFEVKDLLARVESVLRRGPMRHIAEKFAIADVVFDLTQQKASLNKENKMQDLELTPIEFKIIHLLSQKMNTEIPRSDLKEKVWGTTNISLRNIDTHICKLRKKMNLAKLDILNKRGKGYGLQIIDDSLGKEKAVEKISNSEQVPTLAYSKLSKKVNI